MATFEQAEHLLELGNYAQAIPILQQLAGQGHAKAMLEIGMLYGMGRGVPRSEELAVDWFRKASENGSAAAQFNMGIAYQEGMGVDQDINEAIRWYTKASENGSTKADVNLASLYTGSYGVPLNVEMAIHHICRYAKGRETMQTFSHLDDLRQAVQDEIIAKNIKGNRLYLYESEAQDAARKCMEGKPNYTGSWTSLKDIIYLLETDERIYKENQVLWSQCLQRRDATDEDIRKVFCIEVRLEEQVFGRFGYLIEDYKPVKQEKPNRMNPLLNNDTPPSNELKLIKVKLEQLRKKCDEVFANVSSFNPISRIKIHFVLPKLQDTFKDISNRLATINRWNLNYEEQELYGQVESLYNQLKEDLF